ncbi:trypsin-like serine peptidase [Nostoc sp.]|uniref:trypsin-like serine peptidase n=1 Tax=Nostoc sp. TaxID=1180 RepID=UPI002FF887CC
MKRQFILAFLIGILVTTILGNWTMISVQAESKPVPPKFTTVTNIADFHLVIDKKPVSPGDVKEVDVPPDARQIVIGGDDRIPMTSRKYPWSAIGKIEGIGADGGGYSCTGTLIREDIVLTNAHCVVDSKTGKRSKAIAFEPNLINGIVKDKNDIAYAINGHSGTYFKKRTLEDYVDDWAILKLDKPIGRKYGYIDWISLPASTLVGDTEKFALVGYSGDFPNPKIKGYEDLTAGESNTAGVHLGCSILRQKDNLLYHNCDTNHGASGGAIIANLDGKYYVVALHSGSGKVNGLLLNRAVEMSRIEAVLREN